MKEQTKTSRPAGFQNLLTRLFEEGYARDFVTIDKILIEGKRCPCGKNFRYDAVSNSTEYLTFGWCECGNFERFWTEKCALQIRRGKMLLSQETVREIFLTKYENNRD